MLIHIFEHCFFCSNIQTFDLAQKSMGIARVAGAESNEPSDLADADYLAHDDEDD